MSFGMGNRCAAYIQIEIQGRTQAKNSHQAEYCHRVTLTGSIPRIYPTQTYVWNEVEESVSLIAAQQIGDIKHNITHEGSNI